MVVNTDQKHFCKDLYSSIEKNCSDEQLKKFANLATDGERFQFVHELDGVDQCNAAAAALRSAANGKSTVDALQLKKQGNALFQAQNYAAALAKYTESQLVTPTDNAEDVAVILANRSAALYHLKHYDQALNDLELAIPDYNRKMVYKLKERKAKCLLAKNEFAEALKYFKETVCDLDVADIPLDRKQKFEKDAQIMIKMLPPQIEALRLADQKRGKSVAKANTKATGMSKSSDVSASVGFEYTDDEGRFAVAKADIQIGEKILSEAPHCVMLLEKYAKSHCQHCFKRSTAPLACPSCAHVVFCSIACRQIALDSYHKYECGILKVLWESGSSVTCHMALRMISQKSLSYFQQIRPQLDAGVKFEETTLLPASDYRKVVNLVRHETVRTTSSFLNYAAMAFFLNQCLRLANFYAESAQPDDDFNYIGSLILRNLQFLQFNTHEVYELQKNQSKTEFIGGGLYGTLALFNHSCNPGIVRYYKGTTVYVNAIANIKTGSLIAENYGPLYSQDPIEERKKLLKKQYWFDCNCVACQHNWPEYNRFKTNELRFKCDSDRPCSNVLVIPINTEAFMVQCDKCNQFTNILKGLKAVQDTDIVSNEAKRHQDAGEYRQAIFKYIEMVNIMDAVMCPPFRDYCNAQQSIKDCLLQYGNKEV